MAKNVADRLNDNLEQLDQAERARGAGLRLKVSEKGGVSVYGLGRFPVTLYREQWERLLAFAGTGQFAEFIRENASKLKAKAAVEP